MNQLTHIIDEGEKELRENWNISYTNTDFTAPHASTKKVMADWWLKKMDSRQLALLKGLEETIKLRLEDFSKSFVTTGLNSRRDKVIDDFYLKTYSDFSSVLAKIQEAIKHLEKKI